MKRIVAIAVLILSCLMLCACGASLSANWEKGFYLDDFNDPTETFYIGTKNRVKGTYNTASVTDGELEAEIRVDQHSIRIYLYENGTDKVKNGESGVYFPINIKESEGTTVSFDGYMSCGGDYVEIEEEQVFRVLGGEEFDNGVDYLSKFLSHENGEVSFYITRSDQPATNYRFTVKSGNFAALYRDEIATDVIESLSQFGLEELQEQDYKGLLELLPLFERYKDSNDRIEAAKEKLYSEVYQTSKKLWEEDRTFEALEMFIAVENYKDSETWVRKLTNQLGGAFDIGYSYDVGEGVEQDYEKAMEWYLKAAELGSSSAMKNIGLYYDDGKGVSQDYGKAMEWYLKAAELGNAGAMNNIGVLYEKGLGVEKDYSKAMEWYLKAAEKGDKYAMENIGYDYKNGRGVEQDYSKAMEWFKKAAENGKESAQEEYDKLYEQGYRIS